jgi:predicted transcriptional regulator
MKMTELYQEYTVRSLMEKTDLTYTQVYGVIRRMREKNLITDIKKTNGIGVMNAKRYGLLMDPVEFVRQEREQNQSPPPPPGFFNNPFNLKGAKDARYNS